MRISMDVVQKNYFVLRKYYFYEKFWKKIINLVTLRKK